jgi:hypothetical protein
MQVEIFQFHRWFGNIYSIKLQRGKARSRKNKGSKGESKQQEIQIRLLHWIFKKDEIRILLLEATA